MPVEPTIPTSRASRLEQAPWVGRRAVAIALLALLPLLALLVATGWTMREAAIEDAKSEALRLAIAASENHSQIVEGTRGLLAALASMPVVVEGGTEERERLLRDRLDESRSILNLGVVDSAGFIVASALPMPIPVSAAHRSWFLRARETRAFAVGDYQVGVITRQASVNVAQPIHTADGRWAGVVFAAIDLRAFAAIARTMDLPDGASLQVADAKGAILARYPDPEGWTGRNAAGRATVLAMLSIRRGVFEAPGLDGVDRLYGCAPVQSERAIVAVGLPRDKALAAANAVFSRALLSLLVAGCLSLALFWSLGRRFLLQPAAECASQVERELRSQVGDAEHRATVLRAVMDESLDPMSVSDESGRLVHWNRATEAEWGYTAEKLRTLRVWDLAPEFSPEVYRTAWDSALESGTLRFQTRVRRADGSEFPADIRVTHVRVDGEDLQCAVVRDMTETLATQQKLAEKEARLRGILEHSSDLHYVHGPDHVLTYVSPQSRAFFDCEPEEALRRWTEFVTDHPVNRAGLEATRLAIETGTRQPRYELQVRTLLGRTLWVEVDETPVVEEGRTVAIVGALHDVTARKNAEAERGELEAQFRHAQKMEAVGRLAGGVAHDFNNLLTAIMGHAQILASRVAADTPPHRDAEEIMRAADRAAMLTRQLLTFSRREVVLPRLLDVNTVVSDLGRMLRRLVGEPVEIVIAVSAERPTVRMDPGHLEQV
ncbi:MAG TPA: PAS domain S-box protein, partial [Candidatus Eisenbacteria bacterium]|nr:PAS domain S-box protein [Candidatus Eisenbacteria bacterium]